MLNKSLVLQQRWKTVSAEALNRTATLRTAATKLSQ